MKMKFKSGDSKLKISFDGMPNDFKSKEKLLKALSDACKNKGNPFEIMYSKSDMDFFREMCEKMPEILFNYYKGINKAFEKYFIMNNNSSTWDMAGKPDIIPASGHDVYNYMARHGIANYQIQAVIKFDNLLDYDKLSKAVRLSIDAEPILGCRFVEHEPPYWKRLKNIDKINFCSMEETDNPDNAVQKFLESPLNMDKDPMLKVNLIRSGPQDTLCLKINHACCDGTGAKEYIKLLSDIYSHICNGDVDFVPEPGIRGRKEQDMLFSNLGIDDPESAWIAGSDVTRATWPFPWAKNPLYRSDVFRFSTCKLPSGQLDAMSRYAKARGATINDLFLTAYYRAMFEMGPHKCNEPMEIPVTIDLRRYLTDHKADTIRNFSGSEISKLTMIENESFEETLSRLVPVMNEIKNGRPGLQSAIGLERVEKISLAQSHAYFKAIAQWPKYCPDKCAPVLSNLGILTEYPLKFGESAAYDAYIIPPVVNAPGLMLVVSTYNGVVTLAAGNYKASVHRSVIKKLLNKIKDEIINNCKEELIIDNEQ